MKKLKKKILIIAVALMFAAMMVTPVLAKPVSRGPLNAADKNPNINLRYGIPTDPTLPPAENVEMTTPSGLINRWINWSYSTSRVVIRPDDKFKCPKAIEVGNAWWLAFSEDNYHKWVHMSRAGFEGLAAFFQGTAPDTNGAGVYFLYMSLEK